MHEVLARVVAWVGAGTIAVRRMSDGDKAPAWGTTPSIPTAKSQGMLPTLKMPTARGWQGDEKPIAAPGLKVNAFARGLDHPRWVYVLPNGDVLVAESTTLPSESTRSLFDHAMIATMKRAACDRGQPQPDHAAARCRRRRRRRDPRALPRRSEPALRHGAGGRPILCRQHRRHRRLPLRGRRRQDHRAGQEARRLQARRPLDAQPAAEPRRDPALCRASARSTNIADQGMEAEEGRAAIHELDLASGRSRIFAGGLRNPVGLAWEPSHRRRSGRSSTSATAWATRRRPTT